MIQLYLEYDPRPRSTLLVTDRDVHRDVASLAAAADDVGHVVHYMPAP